jgi:hypothetical protein
VGTTGTKTSRRPPGLALWVEEFGSDVGVTSVRELQLLFCA